MCHTLSKAARVWFICICVIHAPQQHAKIGRRSFQFPATHPVGFEASLPGEVHFGALGGLCWTNVGPFWVYGGPMLGHLVGFMGS